MFSLQPACQIDQIADGNVRVFKVISRPFEPDLFLQLSVSVCFPMEWWEQVSHGCQMEKVPMWIVLSFGSGWRMWINRHFCKLHILLQLLICNNRLQQ